MKKLTAADIRHYKPGTQSILRAALKKKIAIFSFFEKERVFVLAKGTKKIWLRGPRLSVSNPVSLWIIQNKFLTKEALREVGAPFPAGIPVKNISEALAAAKKIGFPLILKPLKGEGGDSVFLNIRSLKSLSKFFRLIASRHKHILLERQVFGKYYRITMVDHRVAGILETKGISLAGNGLSTVEELIRNYNRKAARKYVVTEKTKDVLSFQDLTLRSVPAKGNLFILGFSGAEGGEWIDRTDEISSINASLLGKISRYLDLKIVGIDLIATDISKPITSTGSPGYVLEINGAPEFSFHLNPTTGKPRDIGQKIINMLFK